MRLGAYVSIVALIGIACTIEQAVPLLIEKANSPAPFKRIAGGGADPAANGPDNSTEMDAIPGSAGIVRFPHFSHASNTAKGFGIPCSRCHHKTEAGKDPEEGCVTCHAAPGEDADPGHSGPDDNLVLSGPEETVAKVPFNHFTHASNTGYKLACETCHHTGDTIACTDCHLPLPTLGDRGEVIPKAKHAFHSKCQACHTALKKNQPDTIAPVTCEACHQDRTFETPKEGLTLNRAVHIQCIGCHEAARAAGMGQKGPTRNCNGCHIKPEPGDEPTFAELAGELLEVVPAAVKEDFVRDPELEKNKGPEHIVIDHAKQAKSGTPFPHHLHQGLGDDCYTCHHKGLQDPTCRSCHADAASAKKAYHKNCITCHKENNISATCKDCHP